MNEHLSAEPTCFDSTTELKALLDLFGPTTGRYHLSLPSDWIKRVEMRINDWGDVNKAKAKTIIRRAIERGALVNKQPVKWDNSESWIKNIESFIKKDPSLLKYIIVCDPTQETHLNNVFRFDDLDLPTTEEEKIAAIPEEFARVSKNLLLYRPELIFIDPFLNPCDFRVRPVLEVMFRYIVRGKCESIKFWVRDKTIIDSRYNYRDIKHQLNDIVRRSGIDRISMEFICVDDRGCKDRLHARYLLSLKGGVRFDQGFQTLKKGVTVDVSPIGSNILDSLITTFIEGKNDLRIAKKINIS